MAPLSLGDVVVSFHSNTWSSVSLMVTFWGARGVGIERECGAALGGDVGDGGVDNHVGHLDALVLCIEVGPRLYGDGAGQRSVDCFGRAARGVRLNGQDQSRGHRRIVVGRIGRGQPCGRLGGREVGGFGAGTHRGPGDDGRGDGDGCRIVQSGPDGDLRAHRDRQTPPPRPTVLGVVTLTCAAACAAPSANTTPNSAIHFNALQLPLAKIAPIRIRNLPW